MERFPQRQAKMADNTTSTSDGPAADRSKSRQRSRVTNSTVLLPGVDGRSAWMRRCKDIIAAHVSDLGGEDNISAAERSIIRRASVMTVELERLEAKFAAAGGASERDLDLYIRGGQLAPVIRNHWLEAPSARCRADPGRPAARG
jgi:hypothetical protein